MSETIFLDFVRCSNLQHLTFCQELSELLFGIANIVLKMNIFRKLC